MLVHKCILSIFPASVHQFYANILVFIKINPFLYTNDQFALTNLQPNYSDKKSRRCGTSHGGQIILAGQNLGKGFHVYSPAENKGGRFGLQVLCRLVHGGLYRWRENSLAFLLYQKLKEILTRYSRTISTASKDWLISKI